VEWEPETAGDKCHILSHPEPHLSRREEQIAELVALGGSSKTMAWSLGLAEGTVKIYVVHLLHKLHLENRADLAAWWTRREMHRRFAEHCAECVLRHGGEPKEPKAA
jgi:DNA-binding NarL/FixJ family response regulator